MKREKIDIQLQMDFFMESMSNETFVEQLPDFSEDFNIASMQSQVAKYCINSKSVIIAHKTPELGFISEMSKFLSQKIDNFLNSDYENISCIKGLLINDQYLTIKQIETLSFASMINKVEDINSNDDVFEAALNIEGLSISIGYYCYLALLINNNLAASYNELFIKTWFNYFENIQAKIMMFQMVGNKWKTQFVGAPFSID